MLISEINLLCAATLHIFCFFLKSHIWTQFESPPVAMWYPDGKNYAAVNYFTWSPWKLKILRPVLKSQSYPTPWRSPLKRRDPSWFNEIGYIGPACPSWTNKHFYVSRSQNRHVISFELEARCLPIEWNSIKLTVSSWPFKVTHF